MTPERRAQILGDVASFFEEFVDATNGNASQAFTLFFQLAAEAASAALGNKNIAIESMLDSLRSDPETAKTMDRILRGDRPT